MAMLAGKIAAITGGAGGIGEATVRRFVDEGAKVAFTDWDTERGEQLALALAESGADVLFVPADVQVENQAMGFIDQAVSHFGGLTTLVNNAAVRAFMDITEANDDDWNRILGVNVKGYAFSAKAAVEQMRGNGGGVIVNLASVRSLVAGPRNILYDTTKSAILGLTRSMARDHAEDGIRVVAVGPGPIFTTFHESRAVELGQSAEQYQHDFGADTMLKRPGTPDEVANGIVFLASDQASFITGTCLFIDGGQTAL